MAVKNEEDTLINVTPQQKIAAACNSPHMEGFIQILQMSRTQIKKVTADDEFKTLINAVTLDCETEMILRVVDYVKNVKQNGVNFQL
ncbi:MAG: hypothetical protein V4509_00465 [Patescibacteria group bacterium]